ncbi:M1 family metallopeptidase [Sinomicrobium weinanense]|uniref:Aminopeptidase N n=1 Tax=Sinomicrobium weinanense TaxID=2842200 RepID=A0A926JQS2_9FLAO|nr:M1 family metallopeptidase [Sinomicrobium weinanense]MBC9795649.1 M1 family metallopeptidase [Sinomicrobium weinanense]MBU3122818.1 M1 family metallopeptidase [Sinomicrobium weinanense]
MKKQLLYFLICGYYILPACAQQMKTADFTRAEADISIDPYKKEVSGKVAYFFDVLRPADSLYIDARNMKFDRVMLNGKKTGFYNDGTKLWITGHFKPSEQNKLTFTYRAAPEKAMYFPGWETEGAKKQVWTQGQGRYTSNWLPSFDDVNEKVEFDLTVHFDKNFKVLVNGKLNNIIENDSLNVWSYDMQHPMSSYLLALAIGEYDMIRDFSESGVPVDMYYYPEDKARSEPTYRYTKKIFDVLEKEIGMPFPWQVYKQAPVRDFLHAGMENTTLTLFSDHFMVDSIGYNDMNYLNVNAHELAHQWFGNMVTARSGEHHWLQEGFATYYALLAEKAVFGEDHYYWKLYRSAQTLIEWSKDGEGEAVLNPKAGSLTFYEKGAFVLYILRDKIGDSAFRKGVRQYLEKYKFGNAVTSELMKEMEFASGKDLSAFTDRWLRDTVFPAEEALASLKKSNFIRTYMALKDGEITQKEREKLLHSDIYYPVKQEIVFQKNADTVDVEWNRKWFRSGDLKTRQALALSIDTIPQELKTAFESLLADRSYITAENALIKLWVNFPENAPAYLEKTKNIAGFARKNIRMLWLALAMSAPAYPTGTETDVFRAKNRWKEELEGYTSPRYAYEVRQNAFGMLYQMGLLHGEVLKNLIRACVHHTWGFARDSRNMLKSLLKSEEYTREVRELMPKFGEKEKAFLEGVMAVEQIDRD